MDKHIEILKDNFIECLRSSDRAIGVPLLMLFVGTIAATTKSPNAEVVLPIVDLRIPQIHTALLLICLLHFANGIRYAFLLLRASFIARQLPEDVLKAVRHYPAIATNEIMTNLLGVGTCSVMLYLIFDTLLLHPPFWQSCACALLLSLPFTLSESVTAKELNA